MSPAPDVRLSLPARAEGVAVVRQALAGLADALDFDPAVLADMKMAVSEACTNVVVHAYGEREGNLDVEMLVDDSGLTIVVRDQGSGIDRDAPRVPWTAKASAAPQLPQLRRACRSARRPPLAPPDAPCPCARR